MIAVHDVSADSERFAALRLEKNMLPVLQSLRAQVQARAGQVSDDSIYIDGLADADSSLFVPPAWIAHVAHPIAERWGIQHSFARLQIRRRSLSRLQLNILEAFERAKHWDAHEQRAYADLGVMGVPTEFLAVRAAVRWVSYDFCPESLRGALLPVLSLRACSKAYLNAAREERS